MHTEDELLTTEPTSCLFVLSGPSGTGKTSLAQAMLANDPQLAYTKSVTTRKPRGEAERHYEYVGRDKFLSMVHSGEFIQWIHPSYDEYYGTLRAPVEEAVAAGRDLVFDYCPEGYLNLRRFFPDNTVGVFVMAPTVRELRKRLAGRNSEDPAELEQRHRMAQLDFAVVDQHDYHVINDDFDRTLHILESIRRAEKARLSRQRQVLPKYARQSRVALLRYYDPAV
ncbi:guanylate kinase [Nocardia terpenica]|uniref:guanylate kinase n=1 Tax=Nocardia terpenica TaxID=455432 RepID=UPI002FE0846B